MNWSDITNTLSAAAAVLSCCCTGIQAIGVVVGLVYASRQIKAGRQEQSLGALWEVFDAIEAPAVRDAWAFVYKHHIKYMSLRPGDIEGLKAITDDERLNAEWVSNAFDRVGYVVSQGLVSEKLILDGYHPIVAKCWIVLKPYIQTVRHQRKQAGYQKYFELLGEIALAKYIRPGDVLEQIRASYPESEKLGA